MQTGHRPFDEGRPSQCVIALVVNTWPQGVTVAFVSVISSLVIGQTSFFLIASARTIFVIWGGREYDLIGADIGIGEAIGAGIGIGAAIAIGAAIGAAIAAATGIGEAIATGTLLVTGIGRVFSKLFGSVK